MAKIPNMTDRVMLHNGLVVWDGLNQPEPNQQDPSKFKYTLKVLFEPNNPDLQDLEELAQTTLRNGIFKGNFPAGARWWYSVVSASEYGGKYTGWVCARLKSNFMPQLFTEDSQIDASMLPRVMYTGQRVDIVAHVYDYNSKGNVGISGGLDGVRCRLRDQAPVLQFGEAGAAIAGAFGITPGGMGGLTPAAQQAPATQPGFAPATQPGFAPQAQPGFAPQAQPGFAPAAQPGFAPAAQPGFAPAAQPGFAPAAQPGFAPQAQPGFAPAAQPGQPMAHGMAQASYLPPQ